MLKDIYIPESIRKGLEEVKELLLSTINDNGFNKMLPQNYPLFEGKMFRPLILLCVNRIFGDSDKGIIFAGAIELIHQASLIHDDILDNAVLRRGEKALHIRLGERESLLIGDYLYSRAIELALSAEIDEANRLISRTVSNMIEGEIKSRCLAGNLYLPFSEYEDITKKKTALLISSAAELGVLINDRPFRERKRMESYGFNLGMLFQITDDILDYIEDGDEKGKDKFNDFSNRHVTLPLILLLKKINNDERKLLERIFFTDGKIEHWIGHIKYLIDRYSLMEEAKSFIDLYKNKSISCLLELPESEEKDFLRGFVEYVAGRVDQR